MCPLCSALGVTVQVRGRGVWASRLGGPGAGRHLGPAACEPRPAAAFHRGRGLLRGVGGRLRVWVWPRVSRQEVVEILRSPASGPQPQLCTLCGAGPAGREPASGLLSTSDVYLLINTHDLKNYEINLKGTQNVPVGFKVCVMHSDIRPVQCLDWWGLKCGYIQR